MLVHSLASKYAKFVVLGRPMYWTPPIRPFDPPLLKSDDLFFREPRDIGPPPFQKSWTRPCGIRGIEHNWFKSYLIGRKQASLCNNILSSFCDLKSGVPQGSILGPVLFLLFMSDLPIGLSEIYKYADDTMINRHAELVTDVNYTLQHDIDKVCHWFELNRLSLNTSKSNALYIGTRQKLDNSLTGNEALSINNMNLEIREDCTYLGLVVDNCLTWNNHVDMLCKKTIKAGE